MFLSLTNASIHFVKPMSVAAADMPSIAAATRSATRIAMSLSAFEEVFAIARPPEGLARAPKMALLDGLERTSVPCRSNVNSIIDCVNRTIDRRNRPIYIPSERACRYTHAFASRPDQRHAQRYSC